MVENLKVLDVVLPEAVIAELDQLTAIDLGFPHSFLNKKEVKHVIYGGTLDQIVR